MISKGKKELFCYNGSCISRRTMMDNLTTMTLADDIALSQEKIINGQQDLNTKKIGRAHV